MDGHKFTWAKGLGSQSRVVERLDRVLATKAWRRRFDHYRVINLGHFSSNHCPILLCPSMVPITQIRKRFRFENSWLSEEDCRLVILKSWSARENTQIIDKIKGCGEALGTWGSIIHTTLGGG